MGKNDLSFRISDMLDRMESSDRGLERGVVGEPNILRRMNHKPSRDVARIFAGIDQPSKPIQSRIRV